MAFNTSPGRAEYTAIAGQTIFPFSFKIFNNTDAKVYLTPSGQDADDTADLLVLTTEYSVTINGDLGGDITLVTPASAGDRITILRALPIDRNIEYQRNGDLPASTLNADQEYQTYLVLDQKDENTRHISLAESAQGVSNLLPAPDALKLLGWSSNKDKLENFTVADDGVFVNILNIDSIADLSTVNTTLYSTVNVRGYYTPNDGGGGIFNYDSTQSAVNNGGTIINGWVRQLEEDINVKMFGAKGDGSNSSTEFTNAMNALTAGDTLYVPTGTYEVSGLIMPKAMTLKAGVGVIYKLPINTDTHIIRAISADGSKIIGGEFDGNQTNQTTRERFGGLIVITDATASKGYLIEKTVVRDGAGIGIYIANTNNVTVQNNLVKAHDLFAIYASADDGNTMEGLNITNNVIDKSADSITASLQTSISLSMEGTGVNSDYRVTNNDIANVSSTTLETSAIGVGARAIRGVITGNTIRNGWMGISIDYGVGITCSNNVIHSPNGYGIELAHSNHSTVSSNTIQGNSVTDNGIITTGLSGVDSTKNVVDGNMINGCTVFSITAGGLSGTDSNYILYSNNICEDKGINLLQGDFSILSNNIIDGPGSGNAITLENTSDVVIIGNKITNFSNIIATFNGTPRTISNIQVTGNTWGATPISPFVDFGGTTFGANISSRGNSPTIDILDVGANIVDGYRLGTPEGALSAGVGSTIRRSDGGASTVFYVKETGTGNTGWVAK